MKQVVSRKSLGPGLEKSDVDQSASGSRITSSPTSLSAITDQVLKIILFNANPEEIVDLELISCFRT